MKKLNPETKQKILKVLLIVAIFAIICLAIYLPLKFTGAIKKIDSPEKLKEVILQAGAYSYILFFFRQPANLQKFTYKETLAEHESASVSLSYVSGHARTLYQVRNLPG